MITVLADDLSGAQEAFAAVAGLGPRPAAPGLLLLAPDAAGAEELAGTPLLALDLDVRPLPAAEAAARLRAALEVTDRAGRGAGTVLLKLDSLVRGPVAALVAALAERAPVVLCPAVPALRRTVVDGGVLVGGVPLADTDLWSLESAAPPRRIAALLEAEGLRPGRLDLDSLRGPDAAACLARALSRHRVVVADAETDEDCARIVGAARAGGAALAGAAGLAGAVGRLAPAPPAAPAPEAAVRPAPLAVVVGSAAASARAQLAALAEDGLPVHAWRPGVRLPAVREDRAILLDAPLDPARADALNAAFADAVAVAAKDHHLVLTGGQTARAVLERSGIGRLRPLAQVHHGAVLALTDPGLLVATRPGSFGDRDSLREIRGAVTALRPEAPAPSTPRGTPR